jgi:transglutaminase-like putative cysteine protease
MTAGSMERHPAGDWRPRDWDRGFDEPGPLGRLLERLRPDEGWLSLVLVLLMAGTAAWSIADARWILGRDDLTSFVIWIGVAAALWGYISSRLDVAPWIAQVTGAAVGAFVLIEVVGSVIPLTPGATPGLGGWFQATASSVAQAYLDLTWRHQIATTQYGHFCLVIGIVVWGTAQAASYDVFGYHRAINGVLLMAVILIANMALTEQDQFPALVLFSAAALVLLLGAHAADERTSLQRHRVWRGGDLHAPRLQNGLGFASAAICGALILTTIASSAPLANAWFAFSGNFHDLATWISAYLPAGSQSRFSQGADFGSSTVIGSSFSASNSILFTIQMPEGAPISHWRVISYDTFRSTGWAVGAGSQSALQPGDGLNDGTLDQVDAGTSSRTTVTYTVNVRDRSLRHLVVANEPVSATVPVARVLVLSPPSESDVVWFSTDATSYSVTSLVPNLDLTGAGLTEWRLRQASTDYPPGLLARYTQGAALVGAAGQDLLSQIESWAKANGVAVDPKTGHFTNPFDAANAIQAYMRDPNNFTYDSNISDLACQSLTTVDCFATFKRGFCEQYATTMTMLMRMDGFPARYVEGYLSGPVEQASRAIDVTGQQRHSWVEVYFPGYGWIPFDPTGGSVGQPTELPVGSPATASPTPLPSPLSSGGPDGADVPPRHRGAGGSTLPGSTDNGSGLILSAAVILLVVLLALLVVWRRRPRRLESPDTVYRRIVRAASRLGYTPRPTQTVYEYAGMLADVMPTVRDPLGEVATAQVEVVYGRRQLPTERLISLAAAQRRVRQALLRLFFRILGRGRKRPPQGRARRS